MDGADHQCICSRLLLLLAAVLAIFRLRLCVRVECYVCYEVLQGPRALQPAKSTFETDYSTAQWRKQDAYVGETGCLLPAAALCNWLDVSH
jgi:hypothetical protein